MCWFGFSFEISNYNHVFIRFFKTSFSVALAILELFVDQAGLCFQLLGLKACAITDWLWLIRDSS